MELGDSDTSVPNNKNKQAYLVIPVRPGKWYQRVNDTQERPLVSCFKPSYRSVQSEISPRFLWSVDPLARGPSGTHASGSKSHIRAALYTIPTNIRQED